MKIKIMKSFKYLFFFLVFNLGISHASVLDQKINSGMDAAYNFNFNKASKIFLQVVHNYPKKPEGYHYLSMLYLWYYLGSKSEIEYSSFVRYSDIALDLAKRDLDANENSDNANYILAQIYTLRAMANAKKQNSFEAFWATKKAVDFYKTTLKINPKYYDAYYGLGLFKYTLSFVPSLFNWALKVTGLSGDKIEGLRLLKKSFKYGKTTKVESAYHLSRIYVDFIADYDSSEAYLSPISSKYPRNIIFNYQHALLNLNRRELNKADNYLDKILSLRDSKFVQTNSFAFFLKGEIEFRNNNFAKANEFYDKFLTTTKDFDYSGIAYFNMAVCSFAMENPEEGKKQLLLARNGNDDIPDDNYAKRRSAILFENGISQHQLKIFIANNYLLSGNYSKSISLLKPIIDSLNESDQKGEALLILSDALLNVGRIREALNYSIQGAKLEIKNEKWIYPNILFISAKAHKYAGKWKDSRQILLEAERNNDSDFKDKLMPKINYLKKQLKIIL